jgi:hypothetical protein
VSELVHFAALFNKDIHQSAISLLKDFPWSTDLVKNMYKDIGDSITEIDSVTIKSYLSGKLINAEVEEFISNIEEYRTITSSSQINLIIGNLFNYYKTNKVLNIIKNNSEDANKIVNLIKEIPDNITKSDLAVNLSELDPDQIYLEEIGEEGDVIPSQIKLIRDSTPFGGYLPGEVISITAAPGCFTGDTKILSLDSGKIVTFEELYNSKETEISVYSYDDENNRFEVSLADKCELMKYTDELIEIILEDNTVIKCTPDHLLMIKDGKWVRADQLSEDVELLDMNKMYYDNKYYSEPREVIIQPNGIKEHTHKLSGKFIRTIFDIDESKTIDHHRMQEDGTFNPLDNRIHMIEPMTRKEHDIYHSQFYNPKFIEFGIATRLTSESVRNKMLSILKTNAPNPNDHLNIKLDDNGTVVQRVYSVFKFFDSFDNLSVLNEENYNRYRLITKDNNEGYRVSPRTPKLKSVIKYFGSLDKAKISYLNYKNTGEIVL